jgi:hypothetical protein
MESVTINNLVEKGGDWVWDQDVHDCVKLERKVQCGLRLFRVIQGWDNTFSNAVRAGIMPYSSAVAAKIQESYKWWSRPCDQVFQEIEKFRRLGYSVAGSQELLAAFDGCPIEFDLDKTRQAVSNFEKRIGKDHQQVFDGLRAEIHSRSGK